MTIIINSRDELSSQVEISSDLISTHNQRDAVKINQSSVQLPPDGFQIVHTTTGRVRIRAMEGGCKSTIEIISQYLQQQQGIKEIAANQETGSLIVSFDENQLSLSQILEILQQFGIHQPPSAPELDPLREWKSLDFWQEQSISFIPLITGLAVTGGLGIHGWAAIPVYMIAADATRLVIEYLEPEVKPSETSRESEAQLTSAKVDLGIHNSRITYSVVHAIPGRIRLRVPRIAYDRAYRQALSMLLKTDGQVTSLRVNSDAASIAIAYQPSDISISHWVDLLSLALQKHPPTKPLQEIEQPAHKQITATTITEGKTQETSSLWANMKPASMSYTLDYMANFRL